MAMFSENKKEKQSFESTSNQNIVAKGTKIIGDLVSDGDIRIDGVLEGNIKTPGKVVIGKSGFIKGTLNGTEAHVEGKFSGKLSLSGTLNLRSTAHVEGEVTLGKLAVEPGATFNVTCIMKGAVKEFNQSAHQSRETKQEQQGQSA